MHSPYKHLVLALSETVHSGMLVVPKSVSEPLGCSIVTSSRGSWRGSYIQLDRAKKINDNFRPPLQIAWRLMQNVVCWTSVRESAWNGYCYMGRRVGVSDGLMSSAFEEPRLAMAHSNIG